MVEPSFWIDEYGRHATRPMLLLIINGDDSAIRLMLADPGDCLMVTLVVGILSVKGFSCPNNSSTDVRAEVLTDLAQGEDIFP